MLNHDASKVLLKLKKHGPCSGELNGIGGVLYKTEFSEDGAILITLEETGIDLRGRIHELVTCNFLTDVMLYVYIALVGEDEPKQAGDEPIAWYDAWDVIKNNEKYKVAGEGNTRYLIEAAIAAFKEGWKC